MKKILLYIFSLTISFSVLAQNNKESEKKFMIQSKFKNMYFFETKGYILASAFYYGDQYFIKRGELIEVYDKNNGEEKFIQLVNDKLVLDTQKPLSPEDSRQVMIENQTGVDSKDSKVKLPNHKSQWYFEAAGDGYVYIVCPYDPYAGYCLTITDALPKDNRLFNVELAPKKHGLNDDQKWKLILIP